MTFNRFFLKKKLLKYEDVYFLDCLGLFILCGGSIFLNEFFDHLRKMKTTSAYCFLVMVEFFTACPQCFM